MHDDGILNILGPVMIGPSSSHTAGALRLARLAREVFGRQPDQAEIGLHGSFARTGQGHGTHLALVAGLLGMSADDARIPRAMALAPEAGLRVAIKDLDLGGDAHPNTAVFLLRSADRPEMRIVGSSLGGGRVRVSEINGFEAGIDGNLDTMVVAHADWPGVVARLASAMALYELNIAGMHVSRKGKGGEALTVIELDQPCPDALCAAIAGSPQIKWSARVARLDPPGGAE